MNLQAFLAMGGYAEFVWPAWGLSAAVLLGAVIVSWRAHARAKAEAAKLETLTGGRS